MTITLTFAAEMEVWRLQLLDAAIRLGRQEQDGENYD